MKKKLGIALALGVLSFVLGLGGFYLLMPRIAPDTVGRTRLSLDSLGLITVAERDSLARVYALQDSVENPPEEAAAAAPPPPPKATLTDSLVSVRDRVAALRSEKDVLLARIGQLEEQIGALESLRVDASSLSGTLSKVDERQLSAILETMGLDVLEMLYAQASARNQAKLLQAMPPDRAARFIHTMVGAPQPPRPQPSAEQTPADATADEAGETARSPR